MTRIYMDACMVIELIEGEDSRQMRLAAVMRGKRIVASELLRLESRIDALRNNRQDFLARYEAFFGRCRFAPFDRPLFEYAALLRVQHRLKTPDALHLAAALEAGCDEFWTDDRRLAKVSDRPIRFITWDDL